MNTQQWLSWIVATVTAAITMVTFAYATFETKDHSKEIENRIIERLDRIENKLDRIYEYSSK